VSRAVFARHAEYDSWIERDAAVHGGSDILEIGETGARRPTGGCDDLGQPGERGGTNSAARAGSRLQDVPAKSLPGSSRACGRARATDKRGSLAWMFAGATRGKLTKPKVQVFRQALSQP
jgi:hypothetical protein